MTEDELIDLCEALPERFSDRLRADVVAILREDADGGEWDELVDNTVAALVQSGAPVTVAERDDLASLMTQLKVKTAEPLERLTVRR